VYLEKSWKKRVRMARGKPSILSREDRNKKRAARKEKAESAFRTGALPKSPPAALDGMKAARAAWRALMRAHANLPGELFNGLDRDFLINYCLAVEARARALELEATITKKFITGELVIDVLIKARVELRQTIRLVADLEKQVYATPKSRGGVAPAAKELTPEQIVQREMDELNKMIGE
jgi:phage terminase small subunit